MPDRHDDVDAWLSERIEPLPPPPGTFELIKRKARRRKYRKLAITAGAARDEVAYPVQDVDVRNLIASLPPRLRDPFLLHYYGGFGIREVATLLRRPEGTIKADLFAARARLKTLLGQRDA